MKTFQRVLVVSLLALAACGGDDEASDDTQTAEASTGTDASTAPATAAATDAPAPVATDPPTTPAATDAPPTTPAPVATDPPGTTAAAEAGSTVDVELIEWEVIAPTSMTSGPVTFNVTNTGEFPHQLVIFPGDVYENLPLHPTGAVDTAQLAALAFTDKIEPGASATLTADLPPGNYIFICNIEGGGGSHAARGQHLAVTVA